MQELEEEAEAGVKEEERGCRRVTGTKVCSNRSFAQCANVLTGGVRMCGGTRRGERLIQDTAEEIRTQSLSQHYAQTREQRQEEEEEEIQTKQKKIGEHLQAARAATTVCGGLTRGTNLQPLGDGQ